MDSNQSFIVVQSILTQWTKRSRGGLSGTSDRNRVPQALPLPHPGPPEWDHTILLHTAFYGEGDHFQQPHIRWEIQEQANPFWYDCLQLTTTPDELTISLQWEHVKGRIRRQTYLHPSFALQQHQWMRLAYNQRFLYDEGGWYYQQQVLNIGWLDLSRPNIFLETQPAHNYQDLRELF